MEENLLIHEINSLFSNLIFTRVGSHHIKDNDILYILFAAKIESWLGNDEDRYIILVVPFHFAVNIDKAKIKDLYWVSLQTRSLKNGYKIYVQPFSFPKDILNYDMAFNSRDNDKTLYNIDNLEVCLFHDKKKKSIYQYPDVLKLKTALSTFQCVIKKN
jgi:hypothetical protein